MQNKGHIVSELWLNVIFYSLLSASDKNMCHLKSDYLENP